MGMQYERMGMIETILELYGWIKSNFVNNGQEKNPITMFDKVISVLNGNTIGTFVIQAMVIDICRKQQMVAWLSENEINPVLGTRLSIEEAPITEKALESFHPPFERPWKCELGFENLYGPMSSDGKRGVFLSTTCVSIKSIDEWAVK